MHGSCIFTFIGIFEAEEVLKVLLKIPAKLNRDCAHTEMRNMTASWGSYVTLRVQSTSRSFQRKPSTFNVA